jgi:hypothetical protein
MTPLQQAKNLINKMNDVDLDCKNESMCMLYPHAVQCALIAVDEVLKLIDRFDLERTYLYYQAVKEEIIKISKNL